MICRSFVLFTALIAAILSCLYTRLPDDMPEPWKVRFLIAFQKIQRFLAICGDYLGISSKVNITRQISGLFIRKAEDQAVKVIRTNFDGVPVLITKPTKHFQSTLPALVYFHGGGFIFGNPDMYFPVTTELTKRLDIVVISVDYRLAPEFSFPIPLEDCITATVYLFKHANEFGINPKRIGIAGDSAGGNLAAAVALKLREIKDISIKTQILIYPLLQALDFDLPSYKLDGLTPVLTRRNVVFAILSHFKAEAVSLINILELNNHTSYIVQNSKFSKFINPEVIPVKYLQNYIRESKTENEETWQILQDYILNPLAFPLMAENLSGLPKTLMLVCEYDVLRDDGLLYSHRLQQANVITKEVIVEGGFHGALNFFNTMKIGKSVMNNLVDYLSTDL